VSLSLLVVDDHAGVANALAELLRAAGCEPVTVADSIATALESARRERVDVATIDLDLDGEDGIDLMVRLKEEHPHLPLLVLSATSTPSAVVASLRAGASGFVPKTSSSDDLMAAIGAVDAGHTWLPVPLIGPVVELLREPEPPSEWELLIGTLSQREREVLELMVEGKSRKEIGSELAISINTVRTHVKSILAKLGVHASLEAVSLALRAGMRPEGAGAGAVRPAVAPRR
jgi:DNA-binding NarL/FixJ family response regulator